MKPNLKSTVAAGLAGILAVSGGMYYNAQKSKTYAAGNNISKISNPVPGGESTSEGEKVWKGNYIWFGRYPQSDTTGANKEPIKWRVLNNNNPAWTGSTPQENGFKYNIGCADGTGGRQNAPVGGNGILMMTDQIVDHIPYHPTYNSGNEKNELCWAGGSGGSDKGSTLWAWLNGYNNGDVWENATVESNPFIDTAFKDAEKDAIMETKVYSEDLLNNRNGASNYAESARTSLSQDKVFLLSYNESLNESYGFAGAMNDTNTKNTRILTNTSYSSNKNSSSNWWLRSPGSFIDDYAYAAGVLSNGYAPPDGYIVIDGSPGVAPALNLNQESVIFASVAAESGESGTEGAKDSAVGAAPKNFVMPTDQGNAFKLTMKDASRNFAVNGNGSSQEGDNVKIAYTGASTGDNEYISCLIVDKEDASEIKYYGKLGKAASTNGTVDLTLPSDVKDGSCVLKVFNEQCNDVHETDWASEPVVLSINSNGEVEFPYSAPSFPDIQRIDIVPAKHSKSEGAPDGGVDVTLSGQNFSSKYKVSIVFKDKNTQKELLTYPENGRPFIDSQPNMLVVNIPKATIETLKEGKYTVEAKIESN